MPLAAKVKAEDGQGLANDLCPVCRNGVIVW